MSDTEKDQAPVEEKPKRVPETEEERAERLAKQEEIDSRSIYVGNVDFQSTPEQIEEFFHEVGIIERVTILFDRFTGLPKGYAYVEFEKSESVQQAIEQLNGKTFRGRELRVTTKRTNLPGFRQRGGGRGGRGRGRGGRGRGGRGRGRGGRGRGESSRGGAKNEDETNEGGEAPAPAKED
ncbi:uncharacterized protein J8A68_004793 [[Candida] subhashii]|uniref:RRM domain-containing protein n=1 Tax=[Candida] subhashii TaxID=561895 RepID=A0A8J5UUF5_9ASCO|nr:uncharacterized protein J8A68_004793 [[Candida] subhashii]KAG7661640.1 hypothetical protein J8A68_004793 [[Candida] subhashii]